MRIIELDYNLVADVTGGVITCWCTNKKDCEAEDASCAVSKSSDGCADSNGVIEPDKCCYYKCWGYGYSAWLWSQP